MKKVKIILASIAILATIGGAFAFQSKNAYGTTVWTSTTNDPSNGCTIANSNKATSTSGSGTSFYYNLSGGGSCSTTQAYLIDNTK